MIEIYGLTDPVTYRVRYVGVTRRGIERRWKDHLSNGRRSAEGTLTYRSPVIHWLAKLHQAGKQPGLLQLATCDESNWEELEREWIAHYRSLWPILNVSDGGIPADVSTRALTKYWHTTTLTRSEAMQNIVHRLRDDGYYRSEEHRANARRGGLAAQATRVRGLTHGTCSCGKRAYSTYLRRHHVETQGHVVVATWVPWPLGSNEWKAAA